MYIKTWRKISLASGSSDFLLFSHKLSAADLDRAYRINLAALLFGVVLQVACYYRVDKLLERHLACRVVYHFPRHLARRAFRRRAYALYYHEHGLDTHLNAVFCGDILYGVNAPAISLDHPVYALAHDIMADHLRVRPVAVNLVDLQPHLDEEFIVIAVYVYQRHFHHPAYELPAVRG